MTWVFEAPSGSNQTIQLVPNGISWQGGSANSYANGMITAVYIPFGPDGSSTLAADGEIQIAPAMIDGP